MRWIGCNRAKSLHLLETSDAWQEIGKLDWICVEDVWVAVAMCKSATIEPTHVPVSYGHARLLVAVTLVILVAWPFLRHLVASTDDIGLLLFRADFPSFTSALRAAWGQLLFRPLAVLSSFLTDPVTRSCPLVVTLQCVVLGIGALGLDCIGVARFSGDKASRSLTLLLWLLHPSTSISLWQMDTLSQTASAAAGLWLFALASGSWRPRFHTAAWVAVTGIGLLTKETFLGWVVAAACWCIYDAYIFRDWRHRVGEGLSFAIALVYLVWRASVWGTSVLASEGTYSLHLGVTMLRNMALCLGGLFSFGPTHALLVSSPPRLPWLMASLGTISAVAVFFIYGIRRPRAAAGWFLLVLLSLTPVLGMGHVSDLYLFGPNAIIAIGLAEAWIMLSQSSLTVARTLLVACVGIGLAGHASRAYHFDLTWSYSRELAAQLERMPSKKAGLPVHRACSAMSPVHYGAYIVAPLNALNIEVTAALAQSRGYPLPPEASSRLECDGLRERKLW